MENWIRLDWSNDSWLGSEFLGLQSRASGVTTGGRSADILGHGIVGKQHPHVPAPSTATRNEPADSWKTHMVVQR